jgi:hypothetical protein
MFGNPIGEAIAATLMGAYRERQKDKLPATKNPSVRTEHARREM